MKCYKYSQWGGGRRREEEEGEIGSKIGEGKRKEKEFFLNFFHSSLSSSILDSSVMCTFGIYSVRATNYYRWSDGIFIDLSIAILFIVMRERCYRIPTVKRYLTKGRILVSDSARSTRSSFRKVDRFSALSVNIVDSKEFPYFSNVSIIVERDSAAH